MTQAIAPPSTSSRARELVNLVLVEALGSSMTPFVPLPFLDDYLFERLLRRITRKVAERAGQPPFDDRVAKAIVKSYVQAGDPGVSTKAVTAAARFVVRKLAVVLDVKKSHDVFGESIAYALALDLAFEHGAGTRPEAIGAAIYRATSSVGSATLEILTRAGRDAWSANAGAESSRLARVADAIAKQVDDVRGRLDHLMRWELARA
jgi:hypothetical protein